MTKPHHNLSAEHNILSFICCATEYSVYSASGTALDMLQYGKVHDISLEQHVGWIKIYFNGREWYNIFHYAGRNRKHFQILYWYCI